jgi:hypothetical protein
VKTRRPDLETTWDGLPISAEPPFGATIVVFRCPDDGLEVLMLHRAHHGPDFAGDWAWTPPADDWWVYLAEASPASVVVIDAEHDRFEWLPVELAYARCTPELARAPLGAAIAQLRRQVGDLADQDRRAVVRDTLDAPGVNHDGQRKQWAVGDSNSRPSECESDALTN